MSKKGILKIIIMTFMDNGWYFFHVGAEKEHAVQAVLRGIPTFELIQPERTKFIVNFTL